MFESDDPVKKYEIYKLYEKPTSYADFGGPHEILGEDEVGFLPQDGTVVRPHGKGVDSWVDNGISPNRKYYYMFRAVDKHGHISNPSPIYEIEMVNNSGAIYSVVKIVDFAKPDIKTTTKPFRKYLQIVPTFDQKQFVNIEKLIEENDSACKCEPQLGSVFTVENPDIKNAAARRFKIRLTSKSTGKKVDLNVRFVHVHDEEGSKVLCEEALVDKDIDCV